MAQPPEKKMKANSESKDSVQIIDNWINGKFVKPKSGKYMDVTSPHTGEVIAKVAVSGPEDVAEAVAAADKAFKTWSAQTTKMRTGVLFKIYQLIQEHTKELAELVVKEHGKNRAEAVASVQKGNETVEWATGLAQTISGKVLEVSRGVECKEYRDPVGVVGSIVPFNFPMMVPMWTTPIAIGVGNTVVLKPSEKVPMTLNRVAQLFKQAGLPDGVFNIMNGTVAAANAICDHPKVKVVTFVGSTRVAELIAKRCRALNKTVLALGGAKNHMVAMPDCNLEMCAQDIVNSFSGCCGQRCMAASVLLLVGKQPKLLDAVVKKASTLVPGSGDREIGPVIDKDAQDRIIRYIDEAEKSGVKVLLDGRTWAKREGGGWWVGPTILLHTRPSDPAMKDELFGPVLSVYECKDPEEALQIEHSTAYGNAACIYTQSGHWAEWFSKRFAAGMIGVNIGVPVPREPFAFGGKKASKFGDHDITADGGMELFTQRRKVTTKWAPPPEQDWMS